MKLEHDACYSLLVYRFVVVTYIYIHVSIVIYNNGVK